MNWHSVNDAKVGAVYLVAWKDRSGDWAYYTAFQLSTGQWISNSGMAIAKPDFICRIEPPLVPSPSPDPAPNIYDDPIN